VTEITRSNGQCHTNLATDKTLIKPISSEAGFTMLRPVVRLIGLSFLLPPNNVDHA